MSEQCRYRLQRKEPYSMPNILGNHSMPVHTYRWKDIAVSGDFEELKKHLPNSPDYRIIDVFNEGGLESKLFERRCGVMAYINKEKMLKYLEENNTADEWIVGQYNADWIYSFIESQPCADVVETKYGEWEAYGLRNPQCSICHSYNIEKSRYCPNCGARMDCTPKERGGERYGKIY